MALSEAVVRGVVQGLTELLPVSSRGHLALVQSLTPGFSQPGLVFDVALHLGTVLAIVALEWRRLVEVVPHRYLVLVGSLVQRRRLYLFAWYLLPLAGLTVAFAKMGVW